MISKRTENFMFHEMQLMRRGGLGRGHYNLYIVLHEMVMKYISRGISCTSRTFQTPCAYILRERIDRLNYLTILVHVHTHEHVIMM